MARWIILAQVMVYLAIMPFLRSRGELGYHPPVLVGALAVAAFAVGAFGFARMKEQPAVQPKLTLALGPRASLSIAIIILAVAYIVLSIQFGLLNRRQGSELMAVIFGTLPLWALAVIRGYELTFLPLVIIYFLSPAKIPRWERISVGTIIVASLPFMGIADSRGRLLGMALTVLMFLPVATFRKYLFRNIRVIVIVAVVATSFFYYSALRSNAYYSLRDYLQVEVFQRLDGLNVVAQLREAHLLSYYGEWDWNAVGPLISKIPFIEAAQAAKIAGRTSTKQYYIQDVLLSVRLDDSNSMITDPLYLTGIVGMIVVFVILGYICRRFDRFNLRDPFANPRYQIVLALAFATSFVSFEADFMGAIASVLQSLLTLAVIIYFGFTYLPTAPIRQQIAGVEPTREPRSA